MRHPPTPCFFFLTLLGAAFLSAQAPIPAYTPSDTGLHNTILDMDRQYFEAYNNCDLETQAEIYADDLEFYHDRGGLSTSKQEILASIEANICGKVKRFLLPETVEIHPIPGYGAVEIGYHRFENALEPDAPSVPSRFITVWRQEGDRWLMARVISLH